MGNSQCSETSCLKKKLSFGFLPQEDKAISVSKTEYEQTKCSAEDRINQDLGPDLAVKTRTKIYGFDSILMSLSLQEDELRKTNEERARDSTDFQEILKSHDQLQEPQKSSFHEIFLHLDQIWLYNIRGPKNDPINLEKIFQEKLSHTKVVLSRVGHNGRNLSILFKEQIPRIGIHFFEVDLISFRPCHKNEFIVGIIEQDKAKFYPTNRNCLEQSYSPEKSYYSVPKQEQNKDLFLLMTIRVEVCRTRGNSYISFFVNGQCQKTQQLLPQFIEGGKAIVPYIQTKYEGTTFSWKKNSQTHWLPSL